VEFSLRLSAFSVSWLRSYDFGIEQEDLKRAVASIRDHPLVSRVSRIRCPTEVDEIDRDLFDVRYQQHSNLVRIQLLPFELVNQPLPTGRLLTTPIQVGLLLDTGTGFGTFNLCLPPAQAAQEEAFTTQEVGFLMRQWLLSRDESGQPLKLSVRIPFVDRPSCPFYLREMMNLYFLHIHRALWDSLSPGRWPEGQDLAAASQEADPVGCEFLRQLLDQGLVRSFFPTSFGPVLDVWGIEDTDPSSFEADPFLHEHAGEMAWLLTDGRTTSLGDPSTPLRNEEQSSSRVLLLWPNHAIYVNQDPASFAEQKHLPRTDDHGCLDVEIVRILEIVNLQGALMRAFDSVLDRQLAQISTVSAEDHEAIIGITRQRRNILRAIRSYDFFNLFHTAHWESLFARVLENPHLKFYAAGNLVESKAQRLDDEISQTIVIQDRIRQQRQREQELNILRGIHGLNLANDVQNNVLMIINLVLSATAAFGFTEVLSPLLTAVSRAPLSFRDQYPLGWLALNLVVFLAIASTLTILSSRLIRRRSRAIEIDGQLNCSYDRASLESHLAKRKDVEYLHLDIGERSGYLRVRKPNGALLLEFDDQRFHRFILFLQGRKSIDAQGLKETYVDPEIQRLRDDGVIA